jgi:hypothetical protein
MIFNVQNWILKKVVLTLASTTFFKEREYQKLSLELELHVVMCWVTAITQQEESRVQLSFLEQGWRSKNKWEKKIQRRNKRDYYMFNRWSKEEKLRGEK